jgi:hypothetical protein
LPGDERRLESVTAQRLPEVGPTSDSGRTLHDLWNITRRRFLGYAAATSAATYLATATRVEDVLARVLEPLPRFTLIRSFSAWARRRDDLLSIRFDFYNLLVDASDPANPRLVRKPNTAFAYVVAVFWPQNVGEQAFAESSLSPAPDDPPVQSILTRESRLAFLVPDGTNSIPFRLEELLRWTSFKPNVVPVAQLTGPRGLADLREPTEFETALDLPFRLVLSPHDESRWKHATTPVTRNERTELWHTRLVVGPDMDLDEPDPTRRTLRAVWARDSNFATNIRNETRPGGSTPDPFLMSLDGAGFNAENNRFDIVMNTSIRVTGLIIRPPFKRVIYEPVPIQVDRLMLTALGAWINVEGHWEGLVKPLNSSLIEWRHRGTMGRDHYAKLVRKGYLFPYGHPAVIITITERKFNFSVGGTLGAFLRQRTFILVRKPLKLYSSVKAGDLAPQQPHDGRMTPFRDIRLTTLVTPPLDPPTPSTPFTPMVGGTPFLFHAIGTDWGGQQSEFTTSVQFVTETFASDPGNITPFITSGATVAANLYGQSVNLAEIDETRKVDTAQQVTSITFGADGPRNMNTSAGNLQALLEQDQPPFYPSLVEAEIRMSAAEQLSGGTFAGTIVRIASQYKDNGFDGTTNKGELYAELKSPAAEMRFPADRSGGVMTPNLNITGLSRLLGPVADHNNIASGQFKPDQYFTGAKLMGGLKLSDIVEPVDLVPSPHAIVSALRRVPVPPVRGGNGQVGVKRMAAAEALVAGPPVAGPHSITAKKPPPKPFEDDDYDDDKNTQALKITKGFEYEDGSDKPPTAYVVKIKWKPNLKKDPLHIFVPSTSTKPDKKPKAVIKAKLREDLKVPGKTDLEVKGKIENFNLNLFGDQGAFHVLTFEFNKLEFTAATDSGLDVNPDIEKTTFHGILTFVEKLKDFMSKAGPFTFAIEPVVTPPAVKARVSLSLPDVPLGVFRFTDLKLSFIATIPFTDKPIRFRFEFCNRDHPFLVTVSIFGGGGYFGIALGTDGFEMFEAAIEFGAAAALNFGVASGSVQVMAGIYFKLEEEKPSNNQKTTLTGYFKANGELRVLKIVSVSIELYLSLSYEFETRKMTGTARLTIEVSVLFFSVSVEIKVERKIGGTGDPSFLDMHTQSSWNEYADAFAA